MNKTKKPLKEVKDLRRRAEEEIKAEHIEPEAMSQEECARLIHKLRDWIGADAYDYLKPSPHLLRGSAPETIPALVDRLKFDLVVMGTVGRTGIPGFVQISDSTYSLVKDAFHCQKREPIQVKGKGLMQTYLIPLSDDKQLADNGVLEVGSSC